MNILIIIIASIIFALALISFRVFNKLEEIENSQEELNKKLIRYKELEDIRLDLREIKRKVLKYG